MIVDQGMIGLKFYSNQANKQFMSSTPRRRSEIQGFVFHYLVVDEDLQLSLMMTSHVFLASDPSDHASKEFHDSRTK
jgi:hypothetical protein